MKGNTYMTGKKNTKLNPVFVWNTHQIVKLIKKRK